MGKRGRDERRTPPHIAAHAVSSNHRDQVLASERCGCFYCLGIFPPSSIVAWTDARQTALCPDCQIDSVIGSASGYPITLELLTAMRAAWFDKSWGR